LAAGEREQRRLQQILGDVIVERLFGLAHRVLVKSAAPLSKRVIQEFLRLTAQRALEHDTETPLEFVFLTGDERAIVVRAKHAAESGDISQKRTCRLHVLYESPQLR